jgi:hypothetical protein
MIRLAAARFTLLAVFLAGLALGIAIIGTTYWRGAIYANHLQQLILAVLAIYSVPLATILGGIFGQRDDPDRPIASPAFAVALTVAAGWNLLLLARVMLFGLAGEDSVEDVIAYLDAVAAASSFLVVGALAFFFTRK